MVENLIRQARRRFLLNEALAQCALGAAIVVGGFALLLIAGTALLALWTLGVFFAAGVAVAIIRVRRHIPGEYATAVRIDQSQNLHDAVSTAFYFSQHPEKARAYEQSLRASQESQAEEAARAVSVESVAPFRFPRSAYVLAAAALLASGLTALRYRSGRLNLQAPLASLLFEDQEAKVAKKQAAHPDQSQKWLQEAQTLLSKLGAGVDPNQPLPGDPDELQNAMNQALQNANRPADATQQGQDSKNGQGKSGTDGDKSQASDPLDNSGAQNSTDAMKDADSGNGDTKSSGVKVNGKASSGNQGESLLSKLKDALNTLMSQSKQDDKNNQEINNEKQDGQNDSMNADKANASKSGAQKDAAPSAAQDNDPNSDKEHSQQAQGKLANMSQQKSGEAGSGIGTQDGSKEIKQAEMLKAMGKISELIGKRSANVSGETTVEVQSGSQQLRTAYSKTAASHGETDGDVTRDEIPVSLQAYVQQYFAEVRKSAAKAEAKPDARSDTKK
jgi:hypothetical protein